jgi:glycosyltransferase involved in cell wall biosynthesis
MNLLLINTSKKWGGGEVWFYETAQEFVKRGFTVIFVANRSSILKNKLEAADIKIIPVRRSPLSQLLTCFNYKSSHTNKSPGIMLVNSGIDLMHALLLRIISGPYMIIFRRGLDKSLKNTFFNRFLYQKVNTFIANSGSTAETLKKSFPWLNDKNLKIIYNPISIKTGQEIDANKVKQKHQIENTTPIIGIIGRLTRQKGHTILFDAMKQVLSIIPSALLLVVGEGELEEDLKKYAKKSGIEKNCIFTGYQNETEPYYLSSDIVAIPSLFEGFCFTAIEAQFFQKPVIASDTSSMPEVILDKKTGYLFKNGDSNELAQKIIYLSQNPQIREEMGREGRKYVLQKFDAKKIYDQIENLFKELLSVS